MTLRRFFIVGVFLVLTATVANAYTIVMRDGRRVEIPNEFTVTTSTLTYSVGQGIQITVQLSGVDIAATERANGERQGAFLARASAPAKVPEPPVQTRPRAQRSITNRDLDSYRRTREENELAYEKRRQELGLPSAEERRQQVAEIDARTHEQLLRMREQQQQQASEDYWRNRALNAELAATQAQLNALRGPVGDMSPTNYLFEFGGLGTGIPFGTVRTPLWDFQAQNLLTPNVFAPALVDPLFGARFGIGFNNRFGFHGRRFHRPIFVAPHFNRHRGGRGGFSSPGRGGRRH